ncbi:MAG: DUF2065 domain-containing protein [Gammaproteobacteria bacterium]|nr:DUF2065 domain-containing protein [Gammaproteobacteria bacterium]MBT8124918.1 DUF2065 domain-containing protein [Gammaproteobacteria bacterium]NNC69148.1 DUF2065 domain-containing protein [Gammaproteobacteria bacterium]
MWNELLVAIALVLVFEGIIPFLAPDKFRQALAQLTQMPDQVLRIIGLASMTLGIIFLYILRLIN